MLPLAKSVSHRLTLCASFAAGLADVRIHAGLALPLQYRAWLAEESAAKSERRANACWLAMPRDFRSIWLRHRGSLQSRQNRILTPVLRLGRVLGASAAAGSTGLAAHPLGLLAGRPARALGSFDGEPSADAAPSSKPCREAE